VTSDQRTNCLTSKGAVTGGVADVSAHWYVFCALIGR
jgi:hypothetical protein